jgi:hypothetical protein
MLLSIAPAEKSAPVTAIQASVLNGFRQVFGRNLFGAVQGGDRAGASPREE